MCVNVDVSSRIRYTPPERKLFPKPGTTLLLALVAIVACCCGMPLNVYPSVRASRMIRDKVLPLDVPKIDKFYAATIQVLARN